MSNALTPYDTGRRGEPVPWTHARSLDGFPPIASEKEEDRFGKVDFTDDASETLVTVWVERNDAGEHVVHIQELGTEVLVKVHS